MKSQVNALILLLSKAQDKIVSDFGFCFSSYEVFYNEAQSSIDELRLEMSNGCENIQSAASAAFSIIDEINAL